MSDPPKLLPYRGLDANGKKITFAPSPNWLLRLPKLSQGAKNAYARIAQWAGAKGTTTPKTLGELSEELGVSIQRVRAYVQELVDAGLMKVELRASMHGSVFTPLQAEGPTKRWKKVRKKKAKKAKDPVGSDRTPLSEVTGDGRIVPYHFQREPLSLPIPPPVGSDRTPLSEVTAPLLTKDPREILLEIHQRSPAQIPRSDDRDRAEAQTPEPSAGSAPLAAPGNPLDPLGLCPSGRPDEDPIPPPFLLEAPRAAPKAKRKTAKAATPGDQAAPKPKKAWEKYQEAYAVGMQDVTGLPFAMPTAKGRIVDLAKLAVTPDGAQIVGDELLAWIRATAAEYRRLTASEATYQRGFKVEACIDWLNAGKPVKASAIATVRKATSPVLQRASGEEPWAQ